MKPWHCIQCLQHSKFFKVAQNFIVGFPSQRHQRVSLDLNPERIDKAAALSTGPRLLSICISIIQ